MDVERRAVRMVDPNGQPTVIVGQDLIGPYVRIGFTPEEDAQLRVDSFSKLPRRGVIETPVPALENTGTSGLRARFLDREQKKG